MYGVRRAIGFALVLLTVGCSSITTTYDYDQGADFAALKTYSWFEEGAGDGMDPLITDRVKRAVDAQLGQKGYRASSDSPSFLVSTHSGAHEQEELQYTGGWRWGGAYVYTYTEGTLVVDILEPHDKKLIWRGIARGVVDPDGSPQKVTEVVDEAVQQLMADFPPPK